MERKAYPKRVESAKVRMVIHHILQLLYKLIKSPYIQPISLYLFLVYMPRPSYLVLQEGDVLRLFMPSDILWEVMMGRAGEDGGGHDAGPIAANTDSKPSPLHYASHPLGFLSCPFPSGCISSHLIDLSSAVFVSSMAWPAGSSSPWQC